MARSFAAERLSPLESSRDPNPTANVRFTFDGTEFAGKVGEPIAVALLAGGVRQLGATAAGTPRGGFCFVGRCADCMVVVNGAPNIRACITPVAEGMNVESQFGAGPSEVNR